MARRIGNDRIRQLVSAYRHAELIRREDLPAWDDYNELYTGRYQIDLLGRKTADPRLNLTLGTVQILVGALLEQDPDIEVGARKKEDVGRARIVRRLIKYWWETLNINGALELAVRDAFILGVGVVKMGWMFDVRKPTEADSEQVSAMMDYIDQHREGLVDRLGSVERLPTEEDVRRWLVRNSTYVRYDRPVVRWISPYEVLWDQQVRSLADRRWVSHRYRRTLVEAERDALLRKGNRKPKLEPVSYTSESMIQDPLGMRRLTVETGIEEAEFIELWDLEEDGLLIWQAVDFNEEREPLYNGPFPYKIGEPFTFVEFIPTPNVPSQIGIVEIIGPSQHQLNQSRADLAAARQWMKQKILVLESILSEEIVNALKSGDEPTFIPIALDPNDPRSIRDLFGVVPSPSPTAELYNAANMYEQDIYKASGVNDIYRGISSRDRTATEITTMERHSAGRFAVYSAAIKRMVEEVARKLIGLAQEFVSEGTILRIQGTEDLPENPEAFSERGIETYPFSKHDIRGEFDFWTRTGPKAPMGRQQMRNEAVQLLQLLMAVPEVNRRALVSHVLETFEIQDPQRFMMPIPQAPGGVTAGSPPGAPAMAPGGGQPAGIEALLAQMGQRNVSK